MKIQSTVTGPTSIVLFLSLTLMAFSSTNQSETSVVLQTASGEIHGSLLVPASDTPLTVVLLISGSGPTDRNGNQPMIPNNSLKMVAEALSEAGIASLRYDKRGVGASAAAITSEADLRFTHYSDDATAWVQWLRADPRFCFIIIAGHSEGSLIGMIAARDASADAFISLAGLADPADVIIERQLASQPQFVLDMIAPIWDALRRGETVDDVDPMLAALFRPSVQPYMISWMAQHPMQIIAELDIPVQVVQGTHDIQVTNDQATLLASAHAGSDMPTPEVALHTLRGNTRLDFIDGMNHILKPAPTNPQQNMATYMQPDLALHPDLIPAIVAFIQSLPG